MKRILPSFSGGCPTGKQQNNLPLMTHSPTSRAPVHTTLCTATTAHLTTPRPGSKSSTACLTLCLPLYLPALLLFLYLPPLPGFLVEVSRCLPVYTPSACLFLYQSVPWKFILLEFIEVCLRRLSYLPVYLPFRRCFSARPLALDCKVKTQKDTDRRLPCLHFKLEHLGGNIMAA